MKQDAKPPLRAGGEPIVSVVIPSFNEERRIRACLRSVLHQRTRWPYEIIVVDSSADATPRIVEEEFPNVHLIHHDRRLSPAEARNRGLRLARAPLIAFLDADCVADSGWIEAIVSAHQEPYPAIGGSISLATPSTIPGAVLFAIEFSEYIPSTRPRRIRWLPSCNLSLKRDAIPADDVFPEDMEASEDIVFSRQLMKRTGHPLWFDPRVRIAHTNLNTWSEVRRRLHHLGYWSAQSRRSGLVPGAALVGFPLLIPLLIPYRFLIILWHLLRGRGQKRLLALALLGFPLLFYGLACWSLGFWRGARASGREGHEK